MSDHPAVLTRERHVHVLDVSRTGCLLESRWQVQVGTVGRLRLTLGTERCEDDVEVVRCDAVPGKRSLYYVGVRFLWTTPPHPGSIRRVIERHVPEPDTPETNFVM
jgi:PilZ domain